MFSQASVILSTIGLMPTQSLLILVATRSLVTVPSVCILLECILLLVFLPPANEVWGKVIRFTGVCLSIGGEYLTRYPSWADTPPGTPTPWAHTPSPLDRHPPRADTTPPRAHTPRIRSTRGRYASHWNANLFSSNSKKPWKSSWFQTLNKTPFPTPKALRLMYQTSLVKYAPRHLKHVQVTAWLRQYLSCKFLTYSASFIILYLD